MKAQRQIIRAIVMAQKASDAGKGITGIELKNSHGADVLKYGLKTVMIIRALRMIDSNPPMGIHYWVQKEPDQNGYPSILVYFDIRVNGARYQLSFHNPYRKAGELKAFVGKGRPTHWRKANDENGRLNSHDAAIELARIFDL